MRSPFDTAFGLASPFPRRRSAAPFTVTLTGTPRVGQVLTVADFASFDAVQITRNGTAISGATGETYTLTDADDETTIRAEGTIGGETVASAGLFITYAPAVNTVLPVITAGAGVGDAVSLSQGTWTGAVGGAFTAALLKDGQPVANPYTRTGLDSGAVFSGGVTYTNSGDAVTANAAPVTASTYTLAQSTPPAITGSGVEGTTLTSDEAGAYTWGGAAATVTGREYRLTVAGSVVADWQASPIVTLPANSAGGAYAFEGRIAVSQGGGQVAVFTLASGTVEADTEITAEPDGTISITWTGTLDDITVTGAPFTGTYTAFHDGTALIDSHVVGVAGRALVVNATTGTGTVGEVLTAGGILALHADGQPDPDIAVQWQRDTGTGFANIAGATAAYDPATDPLPTYTLVEADAEADLRPVYILTATGQTTVTETGSAISVAAVASSGGDVATLVMRQVGAENGIGFTTPGLDVSGFSAGDRLVVFHGGSTLITVMNINGNAATIHDTADFGVSNRGVVASYVLQAADITAGTVTVGTDAGGSISAFAVFHTSSGAVAATDKKQFGTNVDWTIAPTQTENTVIHFAFGEAGAFGGTGFTYVTGPSARLYNDVSGSAGSAAGLVQDGATSGTTVRWTRDGTGNYASFLVVVE